MRLNSSVARVRERESPRPPLTRKDTGLRHHPEEERGIAGRERNTSRRLSLVHERGRLPDSQQWSPDGAAKACLIHVQGRG